MIHHHDDVMKHIVRVSPLERVRLVPSDSDDRCARSHRDVHPFCWRSGVEPRVWAWWSSPPAPATTPRTAPAALLRAQNSVAALPRGRGVLAFVTDTLSFTRSIARHWRFCHEHIH